MARAATTEQHIRSAAKSFKFGIKEEPKGSRLVRTFPENETGSWGIPEITEKKLLQAQWSDINAINFNWPSIQLNNSKQSRHHCRLASTIPTNYTNFTFGWDGYIWAL
jgi:hypothetical protein